jgi:hypothetical protein
MVSLLWGFLTHAKEERKKWRLEIVEMVGQREFTDKDDMELFDFGLHCGMDG